MYKALYTIGTVYNVNILLCNILVLMVGVGPGPRSLPLDNGNLHVLDLDPHQQEVDLPHNHVLQSINLTNLLITALKMTGNH